MIVAAPKGWLGTDGPFGVLAFVLVLELVWSGCSPSDTFAVPSPFQVSLVHAAPPARVRGELGDAPGRQRRSMRRFAEGRHEHIRPMVSSARL